MPTLRFTNHSDMWVEVPELVAGVQGYVALQYRLLRYQTVRLASEFDPEKLTFPQGTQGRAID